jgi:predicted GNAT family acetyltransferase
MGWTTTGDLDDFLSAAGGFLRSRPVPNTVLLTTADNLRVRGRHTYGSGDPRFGWWRPDGGEVGGAFMRTPPHPAMLTDLPDEAIESLVDALGDGPGFSAERGLAERVAAAWTRRTGEETRASKGSRLYRLGALTPPEPAPAGRARVATAADRELLISWYGLFTSELGEPAENVAEAVDDRIASGGLTLWEVDGVPVSMAGHTRPIAGMARVAPVFTPRELRRHGYAAGATAAVSRAAAALADDVLLFTDAANPTTNALYRRLGYVPVQERVVISLTRGGPA